MVRIKKKFSPLDAALCIATTAVVLFVIHRVSTDLNYRWNWSVIPQYLFRYDEATSRWIPNLLMQGFFMTIKLSLWAMVLATIVGTAIGLLRMSGSLFFRMIARSYVELLRNVPPLVLIFIFYFFIGDQLMAVIGAEEFIRSRSPELQRFFSIIFAPPSSFSAFLSALTTLVLYEGAYITEIVRAGIESIERGQWEASASTGLAKWQQLRFVVLPQAVRRTLPPLAGQFISTIKDSAIVSVVSIQELTFQGMELMAATYLTFEIWITVTALYFILTFSLSLAMRRLELRFRQHGAL
ncbi:MAG: amino acid ABC transporter permease [Deltaproteobacteria bacterium]|nr:amino acid ABC transporter permease [Deltaproteobacteria bacterium]